MMQYSNSTFTQALELIAIKIISNDYYEL
jgi:hypothetical protein